MLGWSRARAGSRLESRSACSEGLRPQTASLRERLPPPQQALGVRNQAKGFVFALLSRPRSPHSKKERGGGIKGGATPKGLASQPAPISQVNL